MPSMSELTIKYQPSTRINNSTFTGREIICGGNNIIPSDMRILAIIMSIIKKGMKMMNPIMNPILSSESVNAGIIVSVDTSSSEDGAFSPESLRNNARSSSRVCLSMNSRNGFTISSIASCYVISSLRYGCSPFAFASSNTGLITKNVRNNANPTNTCAGGCVCVANACLRK